MNDAIQEPTMGSPDAGSVLSASEKILGALGEPQKDEETPPEGDNKEPDAQDENNETQEPAEQIEDSEDSSEDNTEEPGEDDSQKEESEERELATIDELAEHLNVERDTLDVLKVPTKIDGKTGEVSIKELIRSYQTQGSVGNKQQENASARKQLETEIAQHREALQTQWGQVNSAFGQAQELLDNDTAVKELEELRTSDPAEYAAKIADRREKLEKLQTAQNKAQQEQAKTFNEQYRERVQREVTSLVEAIPEWADQDTKSHESRQVRDYLKDVLGFSDVEIDGKIENGVVVHPGMVDHRTFVVARKAMLFDLSSKAAPEKKKRLKSLPKVGAGKPKKRADESVKKRVAKRKQLKESGRVEDAASAIFDML